MIISHEEAAGAGEARVAPPPPPRRINMAKHRPPAPTFLRIFGSQAARSKRSGLRSYTLTEMKDYTLGAGIHTCLIEREVR